MSMNIKEVNRLLENISVILEQVIVDNWEYLINRLEKFESTNISLEGSLTINDVDHTAFLKEYILLLKDLKALILTNSFV